MPKTKIEWYDETNNVVSGCDWASEGCDNCYAKRRATILTKNPNPKVAHAYRNVFKPTVQPDRLFKVYKPGTRVFLNSMGDIFHDDIPFEFVDQVLEYVYIQPEVTFIMLTKRPGRMKEYILSVIIGELKDELLGGPMSYAYRNKSDEGFLMGVCDWPLPNLWLGVTAENQETANERIPILLDTPASVRFVSVEPMLGPVSLSSTLGGTQWIGGERGCSGHHHGIGTNECPIELHHHHDIRCNPGLDWVICGAETGPKARPMDPIWAHSLREQCLDSKVPFFFKKWSKDIQGIVPDDWRQWPVS